eukprot:evm.model.scf_707.2 EVM.evm.TU.scf_707.2   scf_707:17982-21520(-)
MHNPTPGGGERKRWQTDRPEPPLVCAAGSREEPRLPALLRRLLLLADPPDGPPQPLRIERMAEDLGVAPRRLHNVISVLESLQIISRTGWMTYEWRGAGDLSSVLETLVAEGERNGDLSNPPCAFPPRHPPHHEGLSHWTASRRFLRLLLTDQKPISIPEAAKYLCCSVGLGPEAVRRVEEQLGEVTCILTELGLVKKCSRTRCSVYKWIGFPEQKSTKRTKKNGPREAISAEPTGTKVIEAFRSDRVSGTAAKLGSQAHSVSGNGQMASVPVGYAPFHIFPSLLTPAVVGQASQASAPGAMNQRLHNSPTFGRLGYTNVLPVSANNSAPSAQRAGINPCAVGVSAFAYTGRPCCRDVTHRDRDGAATTTAQRLSGTVAAAAAPSLVIHTVNHGLPQSDSEVSRASVTIRGHNGATPPSASSSAGVQQQKAHGWTVATDRQNGLPTGCEAARWINEVDSAPLPQENVEVCSSQTVPERTFKSEVVERRYGPGGPSMTVVTTGASPAKGGKHVGSLQDTGGGNVPGRAAMLPPSSRDYATLMALLTKGQNGDQGIA